MVLSPKARRPAGPASRRTQWRTCWLGTRAGGLGFETVVDDESLFAQWISMAPGRQDAAPHERRHARVVDRAVGLAALHDGRARARRRDQGRDGAGAVSHLLSDRERRHRAGAALRGQRHARAQALSDGRDTGAGGAASSSCRRASRAAAACSTRRTVPWSTSTRWWPGRSVRGAFVTDDRSFANIIMGRYQAPQPGNKGHYHEEGGEFWLDDARARSATTSKGLAAVRGRAKATSSTCRGRRGTWPATAGSEGLRSCRLAMNGFPYQAHMFEQD